MSSSDPVYAVGPIEEPTRYHIANPVPLPTESGQGLVFRAVTDRDGETVDVALKQLHSVDAAGAERLQRRLRPLEGLTHPHLAQHIEVFVGPPLDAEPQRPEEFDLVYVASRWVDGPVLTDAMSGADARTRLRWVTEVGRGAAFLHGIVTPGSPDDADGLVHRDIKPSNVVVENGRRAVLIDYGLVRPLNREPTDTTRFTAVWMAPETFDAAGDASRHSDAWAVGQLAYWALCDETPWRRDPQLLRAALLPAATRAGLDHAADIAAHIVDMLAEHPEARPELTEWCDELAELVGGRSRTRHRRSRRRTVTAMAAIAALVVAGSALSWRVLQGAPDGRGSSPTDERSNDDSHGVDGEGVTVTVQQGSQGAETFRDPHGATGPGEPIPPMETVEVSCKVHAPQVDSANPDGYWYRLASSPWDGDYYAVANTFWNGDVIHQRPYVHNTDFAVPDCSDVDWGTVSLVDVVGLVDDACSDRAAEVAALHQRMDEALSATGTVTDERLASGRAVVAILRGNDVIRTLPRPADSDDRRLVDRFVADYFAGTAQIEAAVDALEADDTDAFENNRTAGIESVARAFEQMAELGATRCESPVPQG